MESVLAQAEVSRDDLVSRLKEFEQQWRNIGPVPRQEDKAIEKRFEESKAALRLRIDELVQQKRSAQLEQIREILKRCLSVETGASTIESLSSQDLAGKDMCSKNVQQRLSALRDALTDGAGGVKFSEQISAVEQAIIRIEILWELESPSAEQEQRRQAQLLMLQHSLKHGRDPHLQQNLFAKIIATPCAPTESMQKRILAIFDKGCAQWL